MGFFQQEIIAFIFSIVCFVVSFATGIAHGTSIYFLALRALVIAVVAFFVGSLFGSVIKSLFIETICDCKRAEDERVKQEASAKLDAVAVDETGAKDSR